jgi:hypothetical protein
VAGARVAAGALVTATAAGLALAPAPTAVALAALGTAVGTVPALAALLVALAGTPARSPDPAPSDDDLALITLLLPLHGGAGAAVRAAGTLATLDYPMSRLEVLLLCREGDAATERAARQLARHRPHRLVVAPAALPDTPTALLSYGLLLARGELVGVLAPGDVPDPRLLRCAVAALDAGGRGLAAAQASLAPPVVAGLLGAWPAAARAAWHELLAPGLVRLKLGLLLSTSGVVVRRSSLEAVGGWDPAGAAEGPDLGLRLAACGLRTTALSSAIGVEEAVPAGAWMAAQAHWWRGAAVAFARRFGRRDRALRARDVRATAGAVLTGVAALLAPLAWLPAAIAVVPAVLAVSGVAGGLLPAIVAWLVIAQAAGSAVVVALLAAAGLRRRRSGGVLRAAVVAPLGLALGAVSAWLGLAGLLGGRRAR